MALPKRFPFSLTPKYKKVTKLARNPISSIRKWLYERDKTKIVDPLKRKTKKVKDKKINVANLQTVARQMAEKIDELVDLVGRNAELEQMIIAEVGLRTDSDKFLDSERDKAEERSIRRDSELEQKSAEDDLELQRLLEELIFGVEAELTRRMDQMDKEMDIHTQNEYQRERIQQLKLRSLQRHRHRTLGTGFTWRPTPYEEGGDISSEKETLIEEILKLQNEQKK